ncbi:MAG: VWA containing CoxE family protein [Cyanobacteria bacterium]|nr:VWA containing CoxE family protein [Cyanobacteriota bacterium]
MSQDLSALVTQGFRRFRRSGFDLGVQEYLSALALVRGDLVRQPEGLKSALKLLWCSSRSHRSQFDPIWEEVLAAFAKTQAPPFPGQVGRPAPATALPPTHQPEQPTAEPEPRPQPDSAVGQAETDLAIQPVRAPFTPAEVEDPTDLTAYWPVSRRSMSYGWRYLRRPMAQGAATLLDVEATVQAVARDGFYLTPVLRRREQNQARLILLIDQNGSMMPFHRFTRDLVETASGDSGLQAGQCVTYYFHNSPGEFLYHDGFLTQPVASAALLAGIDSDTSVLIVSDGGAARGYRRLERIQATTGFLLKLRRVTNLIAWLNPMPAARWEGSSADIMANIVPMFEMDEDGLSNAIDIVRGQPLQHLHSPWL